MAEPQAKRILVAEDDAMNRRLLEKTLSEQGYDTLAVENGEQALEALRESPPDLVLLDIMMPKLCGLEVLKCLRSLPECEGLPVIMQSAVNDRASIKEIGAVGVEGYVVKPIRKSVLLSKVDSVLAAGKHSKPPRKANVLFCPGKQSYYQQLVGALATRHEVQVEGASSNDIIRSLVSGSHDAIILGHDCPYPGALGFLKHFRKVKKGTDVPFYLVDIPPSSRAACYEHDADQIFEGSVGTAVLERRIRDLLFAGRVQVIPEGGVTILRVRSVVGWNIFETLKRLSDDVGAGTLVVEWLGHPAWSRLLAESFAEFVSQMKEAGQEVRVVTDAEVLHEQLDCPLSHRLEDVLA